MKSTLVVRVLGINIETRNVKIEIMRVLSTGKVEGYEHELTLPEGSFDSFDLFQEAVNDGVALSFFESLHEREVKKWVGQQWNVPVEHE